MSHDFPESDWRIFRTLRELALERFCKRVLEEVQPLLESVSRTDHNIILWKELLDHGVNNHLSLCVNVYDARFPGMR